MAEENKTVDSIEVTPEELKEQEGKFFVKDGQVFVKEEDEKPADEIEETEETEEEETEETEETEEEELSEDDLKGTIYEGKSAAEIAQMHKKSLKAPPASIKKKTEDTKVKDAAYYESELDKVEDQLDGMSKFDEGYDDLKKQQRTLNRRYITASQREIIETNVNAEKNVEFIESKRKEYADLEIEITPEEFDEVTTYSERYMEKGKITDRSFTKGLIDKFGSERVVKFFSMQGEANARKKIKAAGSKVSTKVSTKGAKGTGVKLRNISTMSGKQLDDYLESLSPAELADLYNKQTRK